MNELSAILETNASATVFFYASVCAFLGFGAVVSWLQSGPSRRRARALRRVPARIRR